MVERRLALITLVAAPLMGCALFAPPLVSPEHGGERWVELTSRRFVLQTDLDLDGAREVTLGFEHALDALTTLALPVRLADGERVRVALFREERAYRQFGPPMLDGSLGSWLPRGVGPSPSIVLFGELNDRMLSLFQHQLTHYLLRRRAEARPTWLEEGLALYGATMRLEGERAYFGRPVAQDVLTILFGQRRMEVARQVQTAISSSRYPSVAELFAATPTMVYERPTIRWDMPEDELRRQARYSLGAFALVHLFMSRGEPYYERFAALRAALVGGAASAPSVRAYLDGMDLAALEDAYRHHIAYGVMPYGTSAQVGPSNMRSGGFTPYRPPEVPYPERERSMSDSEVHLLWAGLYPWEGAWLSWARAELAAARAAARPAEAGEVQRWREAFAVVEAREAVPRR
jgi:hypothetical protein